MFRKKKSNTAPIADANVSTGMQQMLQLQAEMLQTLQMQSNNILVLYRRTTALALMLEAIAKKEDLKMPKVIRAEIDASLYPDRFMDLAQKDQDEFIARYGESTLKTLNEQGMHAISKIGELSEMPKPTTLQ